MPRGFFSQSLAVLLESKPSLAELEEQLSGFDITKRNAATDEATWFGGFDEVVVAYRPDVNGYAVVDLVDREWPDSMGDPKSDPELFSAWSFGAFGPGAFPSNLLRAQQYASTWTKGAADAVSRHTAFARLRTTYVLGRGDDAKVLPDSHDPIDELDFLTRLARASMSLPGALAFFNPNGELLLDAKELDRRRANAMAQQVPPLDAFSQVRFAMVGEVPGWGVMDTVGMDQVMAPDHEACFVTEQHDLDAVAAWLRELCLYVLRAGPVIEATNTVDGPGGPWRCLATHSSPWMPAPRPVYRWYPDGVELPARLKELES